MKRLKALKYSPKELEVSPWDQSFKRKTLNRLAEERMAAVALSSVKLGMSGRRQS